MRLNFLSVRRANQCGLGRRSDPRLARQAAQRAQHRLHAAGADRDAVQPLRLAALRQAQLAGAGRYGHLAGAATIERRSPGDGQSGELRRGQGRDRSALQAVPQRSAAAQERGAAHARSNQAACAGGLSVGLDPEADAAEQRYPDERRRAYADNTLGRSRCVDQLRLRTADSRRRNCLALPFPVLWRPHGTTAPVGTRRGGGKRWA